MYVSGARNSVVRGLLHGRPAFSYELKLIVARIIF